MSAMFAVLSPTASRSFNNKSMNHNFFGQFEPDWPFGNLRE